MNRLYDTVGLRMPITYEEFVKVAERLSNIKILKSMVPVWRVMPRISELY